MSIKNTCLCKAWIVMSVISSIVGNLDVFLQHPNPHYNDKDTQFRNSRDFGRILGVAVRIYLIYVVFAFIKQMEQIGQEVEREEERDINEQFRSKTGVGARAKPEYIFKRTGVSQQPLPRPQ
ncbi:unnamed protein product [Orchesella dallaii]|uniref:Endoplasmic reticulum transmembrane protein n=1 Tax=Orchesella dallaii TaxID=48710 RepID=A0ABP1PMD2_9HEXA